MKNSLLLLFLFLCLSCGGPGVDECLPLPDNFEKLYTIIEERDISYKSGDYKIFRYAYKIVVPPYNYVTSEHIKNNCRHLVREIHKKKGVRNISVLVYNSESEKNDPYTVALYEFCPYGDWGRTDEDYQTKNEQYAEHLKMR